MQTYTSKQIKQAFWKQFHLCGELFFDYLGTDKENERSTNSRWIGFFEELVMIKKAEKEKMIEIPLCMAFNDPKTAGNTMACTSAVKTTTGVWVCKHDFFLELAPQCNPRDCEHKNIRKL